MGSTKDGPVNLRGEDRDDQLCVEAERRKRQDYIPLEQRHAPMIEQLESWATALDAALLLPPCAENTPLRQIARNTVDAMRQVAADLAREED